MHLQGDTMHHSRIIKVLQNGWEIPYPDDSTYRDMIFRKDYRMNEFPRADDGSWLAEISSGDYLEWLQEYLQTTPIDITEEQEMIRDHIFSNQDFSAGYLGWIAGFNENVGALRPSYDFPEDFETNPDIITLKGIIEEEDPYEDFRQLVEDGEEEVPSRLEFILEDYGWWLIKKEDELYFQKYWPDFKKLEPLHWMFGLHEQMVEYADFGWRIYLSFTLMKYRDRERRVSELERFFDEYSDAIHK
jgi:hypothetical protein